MGTTTNFAPWLHEEIENEQDKQDLINSVRCLDTFGNFTTTENNGQLLVRGAGCEELRITNEKARDLFIRMVEHVKVLDELDIAFRRAPLGMDSGQYPKCRKGSRPVAWLDGMVDESVRDLGVHHPQTRRPVDRLQNSHHGYTDKGRV